MPTIHCEKCHEHSGIEGRMKRAEDDIQAIWARINHMIGWVVAGMGSMIAYFMVLAGDKIFEVIKR